MATINDIGIPGVGTGVLQPKLKNLWRVTFANIGGGPDSQPLSFTAASVSRPNITYEVITVKKYTSVVHFQGGYEFDPCNIAFHDDVSGSASKVLQAQQQKQQWLVGAEGPWLSKAPEASLYKFVTYLEMLDGREQVIERWTLEGCWLASVNYGELDYNDTSTPLEITTSIRYDVARQSLGGYKAGLGIATGGAGA